MLKTIVKRAIQVIPVLFIIVTFTFVLTRMIPGDPVTAMVGDQQEEAIMQQVREEMGLDKPIGEQYIEYLKAVLNGNFGKSYYYSQPVTEVLLERLPNTLLLTITSLCFAVVIGVMLGAMSAIHQYSIWDYVFTVLALVGISLPIFWLGLLMVLVFSVNLGWLPTMGMGDAAKGAWDVISHMIMPCICLTVVPAATFTRITRSSLIEAMNNESVRCLRARGIREKRVIWRHAFKNALPPILTVLGMQLAGAFSGAVITENIFAWPGMGAMISNAINNRDYSLIQGAVLVTALAFVFFNLVIDILYMIINPKVAMESAKGGK